MVTKREERGYRLASLTYSIVISLPQNKRERYISHIKRIVPKYRFYSTQETRGSHPRSVEKRPPQLNCVNYFSGRSMAFFIVRYLEDGLVKVASERSREFFLYHFDKLIEGLELQGIKNL